MATSQIATNMSAIRTHNVFAKNNAGMSAALQRVSTGLKINSAKDGGAQYAISEKMRERINSNAQVSQNVQNDNAMSRTASSGLDTTLSILKTLKARALDAANDSNTEEDRAKIQTEVTQLISQIDRNAEDVKYNNKALLDGSYSERVITDSKTIYSNTALGQADGVIGITGYDTATLVVSWNSGGAAFKKDDIVNLNSDTKLSAVISNANDQLVGLEIVTKSATVEVDKDKNNEPVKASADAAFAVSDKTGKAARFSDLKIEVILNKDNSTFKSYSFDKLQLGEDKNEGDSLNFQIGEQSGMAIGLNIGDMSAAGLGINNLNVEERDSALAGIAAIDTAINTVLTQQADIGAMEQRLGYVADNLDTINENLQAADSALRDSDLSKEISDFMKYSVLSQASQYMLAQSHQNAFQVLNLLQ